MYLCKCGNDLENDVDDMVVEALDRRARCDMEDDITCEDCGRVYAVQVEVSVHADMSLKSEPENVDKLVVYGEDGEIVEVWARPDDDQIEFELAV